jgi:tetratricopeptide (TPR) repeat protein
MTGQNAQVRGERNIIVQASGSGHTINVHGLPYLTLISPLLNKVRAPVRDLDLLDPGSRAVPLTGRDQDKRDLHQWLSSERAISVRSITGPGGSGKTRLALEMMLEVAGETADPWDAGFLSHAEARRLVTGQNRLVTGQNLSSWGWQQNTLIVIDYAASLAPELRIFLGELSNSQSIPGSPRLRVLLLERHASTETAWYKSLVSGRWKGAAVEDLFDPREPVKIRPVLELADRIGILRTTLERAASLRSCAVPFLPGLGTDAAFEERLLDPQWSDPLMLMMAALTALNTGVATALSLSRPEIAGRLAEREVARIRDFAPNQDWDVGDLLVHLAAFVTLCGGLSKQAALSAADKESSALGLQYPNGHGAAVSKLHDALPAIDGAVEPVRPDLIGEAFLLKVWNPKPPGCLVRALTVAEKNVINVLLRTAQDFADDREPRPLRWLDELFSQTGDARLLSAVSDALPLETVCLREFALRIVTAVMPLTEDAERCRLLVHLSLRQSDLGQREQALASIEEAVRLYRDLAAARPDAFRPDLARSLNNLSVQQSDLGQREQALASIEEAVRIRRDLAATRPDAFRPDLARSLGMLGRCYSASDNPEEALLSVTEALACLRPDFLAFPTVFAGLAGALLNDYVACTESLRREPNLEILGPYLQYFNRPNPSDNISHEST